MQAGATSLHDSKGEGTLPFTVRSKSFHSWNGLNVIKASVYETAGPLLLLTIGSIAARFLWSPASLPLLTIAIGMVLTKIVVKLSSEFPKIPMTEIREKVYATNQKYPRLPIICTLASVALRYVSTPVSLIASLGTGMYMAIWLSIKSGSQPLLPTYVRRGNSLSDVGL